MKLTTSVPLKLYLAILNATLKPLHQVTLPPEVTMKLAPPEKPKHPSQMEKLTALISPDPEYMKLWAEDFATLYLAATLYYMCQESSGCTSKYEADCCTVSCQDDGPLPLHKQQKSMREDPRRQHSIRFLVDTTHFTRFASIMLP